MKNNSKAILGVIIAAAALGGLVWFARPDAKDNNTASVASGSAGALSSEESSFDFGTISMASGNVSHQFKIKNTGSGPVVLEKMYTSCMCTTAKLLKGGESFGPFGMAGHGFIPKINEPLGPGEEASVEVIFDPAAHGPAGVGKIERAVAIENDAGRPLEFGFTAFVTP